MDFYSIIIYLNIADYYIYPICIDNVISIPFSRRGHKNCTFLLRRFGGQNSTWGGEECTCSKGGWITDNECPGNFWKKKTELLHMTERTGLHRPSIRREFPKHREKRKMEKEEGSAVRKEGVRKDRRERVEKAWKCTNLRRIVRG